MEQNQAEWKKWFESNEPQDMDLPAGLDLTAWLRLVLLNALRPEKLLFCVAQMVNSYLGQKFVESPPFDLEGSFEDSEPLMPLIFVLSSGSDPTVLFFNFAEEKGFAEKKKLLSLGQDQGPKVRPSCVHPDALSEHRVAVVAQTLRPVTGAPFPFGVRGVPRFRSTSIRFH